MTASTPLGRRVDRAGSIAAGGGGTAEVAAALGVAWQDAEILIAAARALEAQSDGEKLTRGGAAHQAPRQPEAAGSSPAPATDLPPETLPAARVPCANVRCARGRDGGPAAARPRAKYCSSQCKNAVHARRRMAREPDFSDVDAETAEAAPDDRPDRRRGGPRYNTQPDARAASGDPRYRPRKRPCLNCGRVFRSEGAHDRLCVRCGSASAGVVL